MSSMSSVINDEFLTGAQKEFAKNRKMIRY